MEISNFYPMNNPQSTLTTKDILRIIPLDEAVREKIIRDYPDNMDYDEAVRIEELAWDVYYVYFDLVYQDILKEEVSVNLQVMNNELHAKVLQKTKEKLSQKKETLTTNAELEKLRAELHTVVQSGQ